MKNRNEVHSTTNNAVYNRITKKRRAANSEIRCGICGYNRGCNHNNKTFTHKSWKVKRKSKRKTQYKPK